MLLDGLKRYLPDSYKSLLFFLGMKDIEIKSGEGLYLYTDRGQKILDLWSGYGANAFGYNHKRLKGRLIELLNNNTVNLCFPFIRDETERLKKNLLEISGLEGGDVFFTTGGSEAIDTAIRVIDSIKGAGEKIMTFTNSFHGKMIGSLSLSNQKNLIKRRFYLKDVVVAEFNNIDSFYSSLKSNKISGVIIEPIQANGGIVPAKRDFMFAISRECKKRGIPLIIDEVSTGLGRTGRWFAYNDYDEIVPDILCIGKHLGGGIFPLGACIINKDVKNRILSDALHLNTTFSNQYLAHSIGNEVLNIMKEGEFLDDIRRKGEYLFERLAYIKSKHPDKINDVRGRGLICGIELKNFILKTDINLYSLAIIRNMFLKKNILIGMTSSNTSVLRLHPPFIISRKDIDEFISAFDDILSIDRFSLIKEMGIDNIKGLIE